MKNEQPTMPSFEAFKGTPLGDLMEGVKNSKECSTSTTLSKLIDRLALDSTIDSNSGKVTIEPATFTATLANLRTLHRIVMQLESIASKCPF